MATTPRVQNVSTLKVLQTNCNRQKVVSVEVALYMAERHVDVALLQEQYVQNGTGLVVGFPSGTRLFNNTVDNRTAVAVNSTEVDAVHMTSMGPCGTCVHMKGPYGEIMVCSLYLSPRCNLAPHLAYLEQVTAAARGVPLLVGLDANATSQLWHSKVRRDARGRTRNDARGRELEETITALGLIVLNERSERFTFCGSNGSSDIDVTLANDVLLDRFDVDWRVTAGATNSDHNAIEITLKYAEQQPGVTIGRRWTHKTADWTEFKRVARAHAENLDVRRTTADALQREIEQIATTACEASMTLERPRVPSKPKWWTTELSAARREARAARHVLQDLRRRAHRDAPPTNEELRARRNYRTERRRFAAAIQSVKTDDWHRFVTTTGNAEPWGAVYRICRKKKSFPEMGSFRKANGEQTRSWTEGAETLLNKFVPDVDPTDRRPDPRAEDEAPDDITVEEIDASLCRFRPKRAPGLDGKRAPVYQQLLAAIPDVIVALFNKCLEEGCFPRAWKEGHIVSFLKSPEKDPADVSSYRPITLLPILGKVFERVLVNRLNATYTGRNPAQYGFTPGRSTIDAWFDAKHRVQRLGETSKYVVGIFVDFAGAFDHLNWGPILQKLGAIGCKEIRVWESYFAERRSCMKGRMDVVWKNLARGCPQGSICGPIMWNMVMDELLDNLRDRNIEFVAYADDLLLIVGGQSRQHLGRLATDAVSMVSDWGQRAGVSVSTRKTEAMMLKGGFDIERQPIVTILNCRVPFVGSLKYLGIFVSAGMRFEVHLRETRAKLAGVVAPLRRVLKKSWGMNRRSTKLWLNGLLKPIALYGAAVWIDAATSIRGRRMVDSMHRTVLASCAKVCRTVSTHAMQVLMGAIPWDIEVRIASCRYKMRRGLPMGDADIISNEDATHENACALMVTRAIAQWRERWTHSEKGRTTFEFITSADMMLKNDAFDPPMRTGFLLTGHGSLNQFLYERNLAADPECCCGHDSEDWRHVLVECMLYDDIRDLNAMGVVRKVDGTYDFGRVLESADTYQALTAFAKTLFQRRLTLREQERLATT